MAQQQGLGLAFRAHHADRRHTRADEHDAGVMTSLREICIFGQEPIARMNRLCTRGGGGSDDARAIEIALVCGGRAYPQRFIGVADMARVGVGSGINRDRLNAEAARGVDNSARNLAPVRDQNLV